MEDMDISDLSSETIKCERKTRRIMGCNYINTDGFLSCLGHPEHFLLVYPSAKSLTMLTGSWCAKT